MITYIASLILFQTPPQFRLNDGTGHLRVVVDTAPVKSEELRSFLDLSPEEFESKANGVDWHLVKGRDWKAIVSESYLPLFKMRQLTRLHELFVNEPDLLIDAQSNPEILRYVRDYVSEMGGLPVARIARSPEFNAVVSSESQVTLELSGKQITVQLTGPSESRPQPSPVTEVDDEEADKVYHSTRNEGVRSPLFSGNYTMLPMCLSTVDLTNEHRLDSFYSEIAFEIGIRREAQRILMREAYLNFLNWINQESNRLLAGTKINGSSNEWPAALREEMVRRVKRDFKDHGFNSASEAEAWAESGPRLTDTKIRPYVRVEGHDAKSGQYWGFRVDMRQSWLLPPPSLK